MSARAAPPRASCWCRPPPNEWKVPASECTASNSVITHTASGKTTTYGKVVEAAAKLTPPADADVKLKDPKDWKIAGKGLKRLDTVDKTTGKMTYGIDVKLPGMLNAAIKACPVFGGKLKSYDEAKVMGMKGVKKVVKVDDTASRRRRRYLVARQVRARSAADCLGRRRQRQGLQRVDRQMARRRPRQCPAGLYRQHQRRRQGGDCRCRQEGRGGLQLSLPEPRHDGAAQRDSRVDRGQMRGLVRHAERRSGLCRDAGSVGPVSRQMRRATSRCSVAASAAAARPTMSSRRS